MVKLSSMLWLVGLSLCLSSLTASAQVQVQDILRQSSSKASDLAKDPIFNLGRRSFTDTVRRGEFKEYNGTLTEINNCNDTTLQTFVYVRRPSPWKAGVFLGPNFAYCGTWQGTFGSTPRDNTLYNGSGFNLTANLDHYFSRPERRVRIGLGTAFGYQNYFTRDAYKDQVYAIADAQGVPRSSVDFRSKGSEDWFITVGPVASIDLFRSKKISKSQSLLGSSRTGWSVPYDSCDHRRVCTQPEQSVVAGR